MNIINFVIEFQNFLYKEQHHVSSIICYVLFQELIFTTTKGISIPQGKEVVIMEKHVCENRLCGDHTWGVRKGHTTEVVENIKAYLQSRPANYCGQMETLLELIYQAYTEFNSAETPEFKAIIDPLDKILRSLVDTDEEADEYMNVVFELCTAYERQSYIEGMKTGARLMMELWE